MAVAPLGPFTAEKEMKIDRALFGGYVIRAGSRLIVAAVPGNPNYSAEGMARLIAAGCSHLPKLLAAARDCKDILQKLGALKKNYEKVFRALDMAESSLEDKADLSLKVKARSQIEEALLIWEHNDLRDTGVDDLLEAIARAEMEWTP
jgi:hypothetical protein